MSAHLDEVTQAARECALLVAGVRAADRRLLAKAITLAESTRGDHQALARDVMTALLPHTGQALRMGITGAPGVGKSTLIEALGLHLIALGRRVAVLAVDPSSSVSGGSVLGDKTRMVELSRHPDAFIRPSPSSGALGGVAAHTREAMLFAEAAGFDVVIVETVGVGQSETDVANLTDVFVLMQLPHAGDDLQAMKKGVVELADVIVYNKRDLDPPAADRAMAQMQGALKLLRPGSAHWKPEVLGASALRGEGVGALWDTVQRCRDTLAASGELAAKRRRQALAWTWHLIDAGLRERFRADRGVRDALPGVLRDVEEGTLTPTAAAARLLGDSKGR
ncbi:MAG TPA: methylmalonyl Co-A mutase-associated GTPase MeaB [Casimicrobiaceae bacterium]|nr:methylmalonyl Co-A mutase-associated GTPase MeaB [Casimicrobiaceae bacterium]